MSLNDPQWGNRGNDSGGGNNGGKRPNQGPPDLEELWRDLNRRLPGLFDKKGGGGGNGGGNRPPIEFSPKFLGGGISVLVGERSSVATHALADPLAVRHWLAS